MPNPLITIIGSLNMDLITRTPRIPAAGETLLAYSFDTGCGGKGANQAVATSRLSRHKTSPQSPLADVRMVGAVGDDSFGQDLIKGLDENGIDVAGVTIQRGQKSGVATIIVEETTGENRILVSPNANFSLRPGMFSELAAPLPDLIVLQLEIPLDATLQILRAAKERDIEVLLNPAPAQKLPREAYEAVAHLVVNESEAAFVTGCEGRALDWTVDGPHTRQLFGLGVRHVVVTLGARGVLYKDCTEGGIKVCGAEKVLVKDTTAAGDTFVGAYAVAVSRNRSHRSFQAVAKAVEWANRAAAKTVEREGAQVAIPWLDEVPEISEEVVLGLEGG